MAHHEKGGHSLRGAAVSFTEAAVFSYRDQVGHNPRGGSAQTEQSVSTYLRRPD
jgi:hypothetical protein